MYREAIISWVEQKLIPAVTELSSVRDADIVLESGKTIVVALFDKLEVSLIPYLSNISANLSAVNRKCVYGLGMCFTRALK